MSATPQGTPKRYLLFAGSNHYPLGGWDDLVGSFDSIGDVHTAVVARERELGRYGWFQIVDLGTGTKVPK